MADIGGKRITRNTIFIIGALVGQKVLSFVYFTIVARVMGVEDTGRYFLAVSFGLLFSVLADLGLAPFLVRESAKLREGVATQLRGILGLKALLLVVAFVGMNGIAWMLPYPPIMRQLIALVSLSVFFESSNLTLYSILRGWQRLEFESIGIVVGQAIALCFGVVTLFIFHSLHLLVVGLLLGNIANFLWAVTLMRRFHIPLAFSFSKSVLRQTFTAIIPFALAAVFTRVTGFVDSFLLSIFGTETMVGLYSVPFKVTFALQFIPLGFAASLLPAMSALAEHDKKALARTFVKSSLYLFFIALPVAFGIAGLADRIIPEVFGLAYQDSVRAQRLLVLSLIFIFLNFPIGSFLVAVRRQSLNTTLLGVAMLANIVVNMLLIPRFGIMGPAIASLVANALLFSLGFFFVARSIVLPYDDILHGMAKALVAASMMVTTIMVTKTLLPLLFVIALGAVVYGVFLLLFRAVTFEELRQMIASLKYAKNSSPDTGVSS